MDVLTLYFDKIIYTLISVIMLIILQSMVIKITKKFAEKWNRFHTRTTLVKRLINYLFFFLLLVILFVIWGVKFESISIFLSSIFAVIGVAFFAQWSILSNVTSGIIMFFTFPYRIGDFIKIHEGDHSIYGYIIDIKAFQILIKNLNDEVVTYPNSMMLQKGVSILDGTNIQRIMAEHQKKEADNPNVNED